MRSYFHHQRHVRPISTQMSLCATADNNAAGCNPIIARRKRHLHLPHALHSEQIIQHGDGLQTKSHRNRRVRSGHCTLRTAVSCSGSFRVIRDERGLLILTKTEALASWFTGSTYTALHQWYPVFSLTSLLSNELIWLTMELSWQQVCEVALL